MISLLAGILLSTSTLTVSSGSLIQGELHVSTQTAPIHYIDIRGMASEPVLWIDQDGDIFLRGKWVGYDRRLKDVLKRAFFGEIEAKDGK